MGNSRLTPASDMRVLVTGADGQLGRDLLVETLADGLGTPRPQVGEPTYAAKLDPGEFRLDWTFPADLVHRVVRLDRASKVESTEGAAA